MIVSGTLVSVETKYEGGSAAASASVGESAIVLDNANHFREVGICQIGDASYVYTLGEDDVTLTLGDPLAADVEIGDLVLSLTDTSLSESQVFAFVQLEDNQPPVRAVVPSAMRTLALSDSLLIGGLTQLNTTPDGYEVRSLPFDEPTLDTITGTTVRTSADGNRVEITKDTNGGVVHLYGGVDGETPGGLDLDLLSGGTPSLFLRSGTGSGTLESYLNLIGGASSTGASLVADFIVLEGNVAVGDNGTVTLGANGTEFSRFRFGLDTSTADASGRTTIAHGCVVKPLVVFALPTTNSPAGRTVTWAEGSTDATNIVLEHRNSSGALLSAGQNAFVAWLAIA